MSKTVVVLLRTKHGHKIVSAGEVIEISDEDFEASPHLFCEKSEYEKRNQQKIIDAEQIKLTALERHENLRKNFQQASQLAIESQAKAESQRIEAQKAIAEKVIVRAKKQTASTSRSAS